MKVRNPQASIWLYKPRARSALGGAYTASSRFTSITKLDITPYLADSGFRTSRALADPNGGSFQIQLTPRPLAGLGDMLDALIEPMDIIEIRGTGVATGTPYPLIMRGFVGSVGLDEDIDGGQPQRRITVTGYGIGRVLNLLRIRFMAAGLTPEASQALTDQYGIPFGPQALATFDALTMFSGSQGNIQAPTDFLAGALAQIINPYLAKLFANVPDSLAPLRSMTAACTITSGQVPPVQGSSAFDGRSVYEVLSSLLDVGVFNELFVDDQDTALVLTARPLPWRDAGGAPIGGAAAAADYTVGLDSYVAGSFTRSDAGVANYFWVTRAFGDLINDNERRLQGATGDAASYLIPQRENNDPTSFGWRFMEVQTQLTNAGAAIMAPDAAGNGQRTLSEEDWLTQRRQTLIDLNQDNLVFETGTLRLKGDPAIKPGMYLVIPRGKTQMRVYVDAVSHAFGQAVGFLTTVQFSRGTGWLERVSAPANSSPAFDWRDERGVN
jgi:hypothetical protein